MTFDKACEKAKKLSAEKHAGYFVYINTDFENRSFDVISENDYNWIDLDIAEDDVKRLYYDGELSEDYS